MSVDTLRLEAYRLTENKEKEEKLLWKIFKEHRCKDHLMDYLHVVGEDRRDKILLSEIKLIHLESKFNNISVSFLCEMNKFQDAEEYLWKRSSQLNGDQYNRLSDWAYLFEKEKRYLISSKISKWNPICSHDEYFDLIKKEHYRKISFWSQYKEAKKDGGRE